MLRSLTEKSPKFAPKQYANVAASLIILCICLGFLSREISGLNIADIKTQFASISLGQWALALLFTATSFVAVGQYDAVWHQTLVTGVAGKRASTVGMVAVAIGQTVGLASISSALVRWRLLPSIGVRKLAAISAAVSASFTLGCGFLAAMGLLFVIQTPITEFITTPIAALIVAGIAVTVIAIRKKSGLPWGTIFSLGLWIAVDLGFAALALWVLLPDTATVPFLALFAAFIIAIGSGILSNSPGGIGPFELVILATLPSVEPTSVLSAILAFRLVYYIIPCCIGLAYLAVNAQPRRTLIPDQAPADWGLSRQTGQVQQAKGIHMMVARSTTALTAIGDPIWSGASPDATTTLAALRTKASGVYKSSARLAAQARRRGWTASLVAQEAHIDPQNWTAAGKAGQQLRRFMRKAQAAGVHVQECDVTDGLDLCDLAREWARDRGGEMGFSMGRYCPTYIKGQRVLVIYQDLVPRGFVTFHTSGPQWSLDLIRYGNDIPSGAVQLAIVTAIDLAQHEHATHFSLGAVPSQTGPLGRWAGSRAGLVRFKESFAPHWTPKYLISPTKAHHAWVSLGVMMSIHRPLHNLAFRAGCWARKIRHDIHNLYASFAVAPLRKYRDTQNS